MICILGEMALLVAVDYHAGSVRFALEKPPKDPPSELPELPNKVLQRELAVAVDLPHIEHDIEQHKVKEPRHDEHRVHDGLLRVPPDELGAVDVPGLVVVLDGADDAQRDGDEDPVPDVHGHRPAGPAVEEVLEPVDQRLHGVWRQPLLHSALLLPLHRLELWGEGVEDDGEGYHRHGVCAGQNE